MLTMLIVIAVTRIVVQVECAVGSSINTQLDGTAWILCCVLDLRTHGKYGSSVHVGRHAIQWSVGLDLLAVFR